MEIESVLVNGVEVPHCVVCMACDGGCLFHALSYCLYGIDSRGDEVRAQVVEHIFTNRDRFKIMSTNSK